MPQAHGRRRHPGRQFARPTHAGYRPLILGGESVPSEGGEALRGLERLGMTWSDARDGEQAQYPDIGPEAVDGAVHIRPQSLSRPLFAETIIPPEVVDALPALPDADYPQGCLVFLTTDAKLYRNTDGSTWSVAVDGEDIIANSITAGQIAAGAIGTDELAADAVIANVANVGDTVTIDDTGITIEDGKLFLLDNYGSSVLTGAGFAGAWIPFIHSGVYNAGWAAGPHNVEAATSEVGGADTEAEYQASLSDTIPYWVVGDNSNFEAGDNWLSLATDPESPTGRILFSNGHNNSRHYLYQDMPVVPGQIYAVRALDQWGVNGSGEISLGHTYSWRDVDRAIIGSEVTQSILHTNSLPGAFTERTVVGGLLAPAGARYLRFGIDITHGGATVNDASLYLNAYVRLSQMQEAFNILGIERRGLAADVFRIYFQGDQFGSFSIDEGGKLQWGLGGSSPPDVDLFRNAAGKLKTNTTIETGGSVEVAANLVVALGSASEVNISASGNIVMKNGYIEMFERGTPGAPSANGARIYIDDNAGSSRLRVRFANGVTRTIATD